LKDSVVGKTYYILYENIEDTYEIYKNNENLYMRTFGTYVVMYLKILKTKE
jgi:hypothetical protein